MPQVGAFRKKAREIGCFMTGIRRMEKGFMAGIRMEKGFMVGIGERFFTTGNRSKGERG